jgi:bifunctional non-homologous end joining protein LigD
VLPVIQPAKLTSLPEQMTRPNWLYEIKHDGFRGMFYVDRKESWIMSRKGYRFKRFGTLCEAVLKTLKGRRAILDGEIVCLNEDGRSVFSELMWNRGEPRYCPFDLVWLNGHDLRAEPLLKRKQMLRKLIPEGSTHLMYVDHVEEGGTHFFEMVCQQDLEGIICKPKLSPYPFIWIKVMNPNCSQAIGRQELFDRFKKASAVL